MMKRIYRKKITVHVFYRSSFSEENGELQHIWVERSSTNIGECERDGECKGKHRPMCACVWMVYEVDFLIYCKSDIADKKV